MDHPHFDAREKQAIANDTIDRLEARIRELEDQHRRDIELRRCVDAHLFAMPSKNQPPTLRALERAYEMLHEDAAKEG